MRQSPHMGIARVSALALSMVLAAGTAAQAQNKQVYFLSWGGTIQTMLEKEGWADQFAKETGYTVTLVPKATSGEIIATAVAFVIFRYGPQLAREARIRRALITLLVVAFGAALVAGGLGALINKMAPNAFLNLS